MKNFALLFLLLLSVLLMPVTVTAQSQDLDVIDLKHRSAEEIMPLVKPFLAPDAVMTARGYKLIIKSNPDNLAEIRKLITDLDTQLRQLEITVSIGREQNIEETQASANIDAEIKNDDTSTQASIGTQNDFDNTTGSIVRNQVKKDKLEVTSRLSAKKVTTNRNKPIHQTIRTSEGQWANIHTGQAVPIVERTRNADGTVTQTIRYKSATTGFSVLPRLLADNRVALYIRPTQTTPSTEGGGKFDLQTLETTIEGKLGEWIPLGSLSEISRASGTGVLHTTRSRDAREDEVFVKIDAVQ